jgi:ferredoxin
MRKFLIIYFSGTGNTFRAINIIKEYLTKNDIKTDFLEVNDKTKFPKEEYDEYLFAFPIYVFSPPIVYSEFLKKIPKVKIKPCSILITNAATIKREAGHSGYAPYYVKRILSKKGFEIKKIREIGYPAYWTQIINPPAKEERDKINERSDKAVIEFADTLLEQKELIIRKPKIHEILFLRYLIPFYKLFIGKLLGKFFIADKKCVGCGLCMKLCPAGAIKMSGKKPQWNNKCLACNRCINNCPQNAIQTSGARVFLHFFLPLFLYFIGFKVTLNLISGIAYNFNAISLVLLKIISLIAVFAIMLMLQTSMYEWVIRLLERIYFLRPLFEWSFTKNYRRHKAEGFQGVER